MIVDNTMMPLKVGDRVKWYRTDPARGRVVAIPSDDMATVRWESSLLGTVNEYASNLRVIPDS